ncbi:MAG: hypothetical protein ACE5HQ_09750 [Gemmatimonadota bacterium]
MLSEGSTGPDTRWSRPIRAGVLCVGLSALGPAAGARSALALAQSVRELDSGRFEIRVHDRKVGTETFAIRREGTRVRAVGRITVDTAAGGPISEDVRLQANAVFRPNGYALRSTSGPIHEIDGVWNGNRLRLHISSDEGERWKEFLTRGRVAVLERGVAHHFFLFFRQLAGTAAVGSRVPVIVPSRNLKATAIVRERREGSVVMGGSERKAVRFEVEVAGVRNLVWLGDRGRVLQVATPSEGRVAIRLPEEGAGGLP